MKTKFLLIALTMLTANLMVSGNNTRSTSNNAKSNLEKTQKNTESKIKKLLNIYKWNQKNAMVNNRLGYLYYSLGKYKNSEYHYKQSVLYNSRNIEARLGLYLLSMANKDYDQAVAYCREIRSIDNLNYYGNLYLVYSRMAQQKYKKAETICRKMLNAYPCDITFLRLLKLNCSYQRQTTKAQEVQKQIELLR